MERTILEAGWGADGEMKLFDIRAVAFCHQMVRSIVGFLVAVGTGKRRADELPEVLAARDRARAENPAPPHGLTLWEVRYDGRSDDGRSDGGIFDDGAFDHGSGH